jgi:hypothetical protein
VRSDRKKERSLEERVAVLEVKVNALLWLAGATFLVVVGSGLLRL